MNERSNMATGGRFIVQELVAAVGGLGAVLLVVVGVVLFVLLPFFVYGTNMRTWQTALALRDTLKASGNN